MESKKNKEQEEDKQSAEQDKEITDQIQGIKDEIAKSGPGEALAIIERSLEGLKLDHD
jgi:hypothetical protein